MGLPAPAEGTSQKVSTPFQVVNQKDAGSHPIGRDPTRRSTDAPARPSPIHGDAGNRYLSFLPIDEIRFREAPTGTRPVY